YIYRGYLQIACVDLTRAAHPALWLITWDPTQPVATRPLAIQKDATWYTYGWDLTKNICEVYGQHGYIRTAYTYTPYGEVTSAGDVTQPIQWSSEFNDTETALVYYNYRHYNPVDGRWTGRDYLGETAHHNLCVFSHNLVYKCYDVLGLSTMWEMGDIREIVEKSYSLDFQPAEALQLEDDLILSIMGLKLNKTLTSYFYFIIMGASALTEWNHHVLFMHRHYLAGTGKDYTYMPEHIRPLKYRLKEGYDYGKKIIILRAQLE
ncbi:MAG: RHS repeat-associated core domain-containing protein, partial [Bacteroidaceae bacterium]|nr:RHS repeat-associated core domain-containing protein [Bacteroidaceae bacterium]